MCELYTFHHIFNDANLMAVWCSVPSACTGCISYYLTLLVDLLAIWQAAFSVGMDGENV